MAVVLAEGLVALAAVVAWGLATTSLLLLLLLLCSFFHRTSRRFSTQKMKPSPGLVRGLRLARLGSCDGGAALPGGTLSPGEPQQKEDGPVVSRDLDNPAVGVPGWTPHPNRPSESPQRTPEFLRHRQLPGLPGDAGTAMADPALDNEGPIYESIRAAEKSGMLKKPWEAGSVLGDSPSLPNGDEPGVSVQEIMAQEELESKKSSVQEIMAQEELESKKSSVQEIMAQEEPESKRSPSPIYAQVHKLPRAPQPPQPPGPPEPEEETPPSLPERRFDVP